MKRYSKFEVRDPRPEIPFSEPDIDDGFAMPIAIAMLVIALLLWVLV